MLCGIINNLGLSDVCYNTNAMESSRMPLIFALAHDVIVFLVSVIQKIQESNLPSKS